MQYSVCQANSGVIGSGGKDLKGTQNGESLGYPIQEWRQISLNNIMARVDNTPDLNELDKINNGILYIYISDTGDQLLDQKHISQTYIGTNCTDRYFSINFDSRVEAIPPVLNGILSFDDPEINPTPVDPSPSPSPSPSPIPSPSPSPSPNPDNKKRNNGVIILITISIILLFLLILNYLRNK